MLRKLAKKWRVLLIVLGLMVAVCIAAGSILYALARVQRRAFLPAFSRILQQKVCG